MMPVAVRVIPCLDLDGGRVVKGVNFLKLRDAGDPVELAAAYDAQGADELVFLDITASAERRDTMVDVVARTADKVSLNTAAIGRPELLTEVAGRFGAQCVVVSVDARRQPSPGGLGSGFEVTTHGGRRGTGLDAVEWARRAVALGVGEILLNSMDADGTKAGFDTEMIAAVRAAV